MYEPIVKHGYYLTNIQWCVRMVRLVGFVDQHSQGQKTQEKATLYLEEYLHVEARSALAAVICIA